MMQKSLSPIPRARGTDLSTFRCQSALNSTRDHANSSLTELTFISQQLIFVIQKHFPTFNPKIPNDNFPALLQDIDKFLAAANKQSNEQLQKSYERRENILQSASEKLIKYEELLQRRKKEIEERMKEWEIEKSKEKTSLEGEKNEIILVRVRLESDVSAFMAKVKENDLKSERMIEDIEQRRSKLIQEKVGNDRKQWELSQRERELEEKEAILDLKLKMVKEDQEFRIAEKLILENKKRPTISITDPVQNTKEILTPHRRTASSNTCVPVKSQGYRFSFSINEPTTNNDSHSVTYSPKFSKLMKLKESLESSSVTMNEFKEEVLPELYELSSQLTVMLTDLAEKRAEIIQELEIFEENSQRYKEKIREVERNSDECRVKVKELELKENEVFEKKMIIEAEMLGLERLKLALDDEQDNFNNEKLAFYEEIAEERRKIEKYYADIEDTVKKLDFHNESLSSIMNISLEGGDD
jgi:hypothetical protein